MALTCRYIKNRTYRPPTSQPPTYGAPKSGSPTSGPPTSGPPGLHSVQDCRNRWRSTGFCTPFLLRWGPVPPQFFSGGLFQMFQSIALTGDSTPPPSIFTLPFVKFFPLNPDYPTSPALDVQTFISPVHQLVYLTIAQKFVDHLLFT